MAEYEFRVMQKSLRKPAASRNKVCFQLFNCCFYGSVGLLPFGLVHNTLSIPDR